MPFIRARVGHLQGQLFPLEKQQLVIGRDPTAEILLDPESPASRRHAVIFQEGGKWMLQDLGSVNGTMLNGSVMKESVLSDGDEIKIGDEIFSYEESAVTLTPGDIVATPAEHVSAGSTLASAADQAQAYAAESGSVSASAPLEEPHRSRPVVEEGPPATPEVLELARRMSEQTKLIEREIGKAIVGQLEVVRELLVAIISRGHVLLIGMPGLAKTTLVRTISEVLHLQFRRIQFTPDLMPSDITGTDILEVDEATGKKEYRFIKGPIFTQILLADEINRTPPKTQAALLEAMQEYSVTAAGHSFTLEPPFFVLATQNPLEQEGTYPLPEAQLDRFMFSIYIDYPSENEEEQIARFTTSGGKVELNKVLDASQIIEMQNAVRNLPVSDHVVRYAVRLVRASRPGDARAPDFIKKWIHCGAGPRAAQNLLLAAKARAVIDGRLLVTAADVRSVARPVMRHRMFTNFTADSEGMDTDKIVQKLLEAVPEPGEADY